MSKPGKYTGGFERSFSILYRERFPRFLAIQRLPEEERNSLSVAQVAKEMKAI